MTTNYVRIDPKTIEAGDVVCYGRSRWFPVSAEDATIIKELLPHVVKGVIILVARLKH